MSEIQLRQVYKDKMYNYRPSWILRWGITIFFLLLLLITVAMGFVKYPDIVPAKAEITTLNPPANIIAKINGKIDTIFTNSGENVKKHSVLAVLQSTAKWHHIQKVEEYIKILDSIQQSHYNSLPTPDFFSNSLSLGELQNNYAELKLNYTTFYNYLYLGLYKEQQKSLSNRLHTQQRLLKQLKHKRAILKKQYHLTEKEFGRDSIIHHMRGIADNQYERQYQNLLQAKTSLIDMNIHIENTISEIEQYRSELKKAMFQHQSNRQNLENKMTQTVRLLKSRLEMWKQNYSIISPISGTVSFTTFWSKNQNVKAGEVVFSVVPIDKSTTKVRIQFPVRNSGKVKKGQRVNIKLENYPYQEFGMLVGRIDKMSEIPNNNLYTADVILENKLTTSYKKTIPKVQYLRGNAEILTDEVSLLMRVFNPLRAIFDKHI